MPICFSASVPVHPDTDGPVYALPENEHTNTNTDSIEFRMQFTTRIGMNSAKGAARHERERKLS